MNEQTDRKNIFARTISAIMDGRTNEEIEELCEKIIDYNNWKRRDKNFLQELSEKTKYKEEKPKRWRAEPGEHYWFINAFGKVERWRDNRDFQDQFRWKFGNYYKTEEETQKALDKQLAIQRVKDYIIENDIEFEPNWDDEDEQKWGIYFNHNCREFVTESIMFNQEQTDIGFLEKIDQANQVIKDCEDDLKIIFDI